MAIRGSFAAALTKASSDRLIPGRDDPALVSARRIDDVEGRRGAEVDDDQVARVLGMGGNGVERAVGADIVRLIDVELQRPLRPTLAPQ